MFLCFLSGNSSVSDAALGLSEVLSAFTVANGDRSHIPNMLIWVTDGVTLMGVNELNRTAQEVKDAGINIITVCMLYFITPKQQRL